MKGQDIVDINEKMLGQLIPPIGKQLLFLREQAALKDLTSSSKLDTQPETGRKSQSTDDIVEATTSTPVSSVCGEKSSCQTDSSASDDEEEEEVSRPHLTNISDENAGDIWSNLPNYK